MKEEALILFVRTPALGQVKTRLAAAIGPKAALAVYERLVQHTHAFALPLACEKFVFYAGAVEADDCWNGYNKKSNAATTLAYEWKMPLLTFLRKGINVL